MKKYFFVVIKLAVRYKKRWKPLTYKGIYHTNGELTDDNWRTENKVDSIWDTIWTGGITSPITVLEQITYLMFMKLLDDNQRKAEANANVPGVALKNKVFKDGMCVISENPRVETEYRNLRWNVFHNFEPGEMLTNIQTCVFPFVKTIGEGKDTAFSRYMKDTVFLIPTAKVLAKVVDGIDAMDMNNKDIMGDVYEYLLGKIAAAGENGQFRTPRHIINMMVQLMRPMMRFVKCNFPFMDGKAQMRYHEPALQLFCPVLRARRGLRQRYRKAQRPRRAEPVLP